MKKVVEDAVFAWTSLSVTQMNRKFEKVFTKKDVCTKYNPEGGKQVWLSSAIGFDKVEVKAPTPARLLVHDTLGPLVDMTLISKESTSKGVRGELFVDKYDLLRWVEEGRPLLDHGEIRSEVEYH